jgi:hypothetical protein
MIRRTELSGSMVTVRGTVGAGGHGMFLRAPRDCTFELVTRGVVWPNTINLTYPDNNSKSLTDHADFKVDWKAIRRSDNEILRSGYDARVDQLVATYVGLFVTYPDLEQRVSPGMPGALRLGFGPAGLGAPGQLLIKTVKDVLVVHGSPQ